MQKEENLTNTIDDSELPGTWDNFLNDLSNQEAIDKNFKMLQISYSTLGTNDKLKLKEIITDTRKLVDSDLRQQSPSNPALNTKYFLAPLNDYNKVIIELI